MTNELECDHPVEKQKIYKFFVNEIGIEENPWV